MEDLSYIHRLVLRSHKSLKDIFNNQENELYRANNSYQYEPVENTNLLKNELDERVGAFVINEAENVDDSTAALHKEVMCCMVCEKYFTQVDFPDSCWSCGDHLCRNCTSKNDDTTDKRSGAHTVVVCLHCDYGRETAQKNSLCMCLFCQRINGEEFHPDSSFIVMDHEVDVK